MAPSTMKDKFSFHSKAFVCQDVELRGDITIGAGTVVHPKATIVAAMGPVVIGQNNIIEEGVIIVNRKKDTLRIGDDNLFEIGCRVECPSIGDFNTISARARLYVTIRLTSYCTIGANCHVVPEHEECLEEFTVVHGAGTHRRVWSSRGKLQELDLRRKHAEYLREMLPKFNRRRGEP